MRPLVYFFAFIILEMLFHRAGGRRRGWLSQELADDRLMSGWRLRKVALQPVMLDTLIMTSSVLTFDITANMLSSVC